jgi:hypothetical protein
MPGEGVKAFQAFALYRDMLASRSLKRVAQQLKKAEGVVHDWSAKWKWVARCEEYDLYLDRKIRENRETEAEAALARHGQLGRGLQTLVRLRLAGGTTEDGTVIPRLDPADLDAMGVVRAAEVGVKLERLGLGLPTDFLRTLHTISTVDFEKILGAIVDAALRLLPDEKHDEFISRVRAIGLGAARD